MCISTIPPKPCAHELALNSARWPNTDIWETDPDMSPSRQLDGIALNSLLSLTNL